MSTRNRYLRSVFQIAVFLMIAFGISPSGNHESAEGANATASVAHHLLPISIQAAQAKNPDDECRWDCTCQYYYDRNPKKWAGQWQGSVKAPGRWSAEVAAHEECESATASKGVNCKWKKCSCGNPRPRGRCD